MGDLVSLLVTGASGLGKVLWCNRGLVGRGVGLNIAAYVAYGTDHSGLGPTVSMRFCSTPRDSVYWLAAEIGVL
jgi:hypothetical protein